MQPGRNDPCPCGSGKKYKNCCARKPGVVERSSIAQMLTEARRGYRQGDHRGALALALSILKQDPEHAEANQLAGAIHLDLDQWADALPFLERTLRVNPHNELAQNNIAVTLLNLGRPADAEGFCKKAIALNPAFADAHNNLARVLTALDRRD
jgi:tetratricopeptide (TPR) repeat protein